MEKYFGLIIALFITTSIFAQETPLSFKKVDSETYDLFEKQDWTSLIELGIKSKSQGIDFYYLNVRMGIAYYKTEKMLYAIKYLEKAYKTNNYDTVVQEYLYWAYKFGGLPMEANLFHQSMTKELQDKIELNSSFINAIDFGLTAVSNSDYDKISSSNIENVNDIRDLSENFQLFTLGFNHWFSNRVNFYHRFTIMPRNSTIQKNVSGDIITKNYSGSEFRYYANSTFALGEKWYLDLYLNYISGNYDSYISSSAINSGTLLSEGVKTNYNDFLFGTTISKSFYFFRNSLNISIANLNGKDQFQVGYNISIYPLGNTLLVPFAGIQYHTEKINSESQSNTVFSGGITVNTKDVSITGYLNSGKFSNFASNNGSIIYNQKATALNEYGAIFNIYLSKFTIKIGYSFMNMEDYHFNEGFENTTKYKFNQQNLIGGLIWEL